MTQEGSHISASSADKLSSSDRKHETEEANFNASGPEINLNYISIPDSTPISPNAAPSIFNNTKTMAQKRAILQNVGRHYGNKQVLRLLNHLKQNPSGDKPAKVVTPNTSSTQSIIERTGPEETPLLGNLTFTASFTSPSFTFPNQFYPQQNANSSSTPSPSANLWKASKGGTEPLPGPSTVQRKVGFEIEMNVPTFGPAPKVLPLESNIDKGPGLHGKKNQRNVFPSVEIAQFLWSGLPYGEDMGGDIKVNEFKLASDSGGIGDTIEEIEYRLHKYKYYDHRPNNYEPPSNLEYVTKAYDELAQGANTIYKAQFNQILNHMNGIYPAATNHLMVIPPPPGAAAPKQNYYTGIPIQEFKNWLGPEYDAAIGPEINAMKAAMQPSLYLQATVGIIPSALRTLHQQGPSFWPGAKSATQATTNAIEQTINALVALPAFKNSNFIKDLKARPTTIDYEAYVGLLHLIFTYMVGQAYNQTTDLTGSSEKNAVPFLSHLELNDIMTNTTTTYLKQKRLDPNHLNLIPFISNFFGNRPHITRNYWIQQANLGLKAAVPARPNVIEANFNSFVSDVLQGVPVKVLSNEVNYFKAPDPMPAAVRAESENQEGVQLEYRRIDARPDFNGLEAEFFNIINQVRKLNTQHMNQANRDALIKKAEQ